MRYVGKFKIEKERLEYYTDLLSIEDLEQDDKGIGLKDDYIGIAKVDFDNGNFITIDLASGSTNYYDNIVLWDKDGNELICSDCTYDIDNFSLFYGEDIYDVYMEAI